MGRGSGKRESWRQSVTGEGVLTQVLASGNPLTSGVWWVLKHPWMRLLVAILVLVLDLYVYYGDPATFSNAESYGTLIGDIYAGWLEPGDSTFVFYRIVVMLALTGFGIATGLGVHRLFRDRFELTAFGFDASKGADEHRNPLNAQDGAIFLVFMATVLAWYLGLKLYNGFLSLVGRGEHRTDAGMAGWNYAGYRATKGCFNVTSTRSI